MKTIQRSANSHAVIAGEIIDQTSNSRKQDKPWLAIKNNGQRQYFTTKQQAAIWILS